MSVLLLLILGTIWGSGYSLAKYATTHGITPLNYSFWQCLGPVLVLSIVNLIYREKSIFKKEYFFFFLISGALGLAIPNAIMYNMAPRLPSGILSIIINIVPVITFALTVGLGLNRFSWKMFWAVFLTMLGLGLILLPNIWPVRGHLLPYMLVSLSVPCCFSGYAIYIQSYRHQGMSARVMALGMLSSATLLQAPFIIYFHQFYWFHVIPTLPDLAVILEIILSSLGYIILFKLINRAGANYYSLVPAVVVMVGVLWGKLFFHEVITIYIFGSLICIVMGIILATYKLSVNK